MGRLIDADKAISDYAYYGISHPYDACDLEDILAECSTVEAIPKDRIAKAIDKVEEYICDVETDTVKAQGMAQALDIFEQALGEVEDGKIDDNDKQVLLDSLAKEPTMVLSTAYVYAKNYVNYGEDITKVWTTAVQQAYILEKVRYKAQAEAYDSFKKDYENRLKADMVAMLTELQLEIEESENCGKAFHLGLQMANNIIQQKINKLKENTNGLDL